MRRWHLEEVIVWIREEANRGLSRSVAALALCFAVIVVPAALHAQTYTDLHDFDCTVEGCQPAYPAILAQGRDGNLYGTTDGGGSAGKGTVFKVTPSGTFTTLYNFSGTDGANPDGGLVLGLDGNLYGTTRYGGTNNLGTIFKMTPGGTLTTLHSFIASEGSEPRGGLVLGKNGSFYGTTCGFNVPWVGFSITSAGKFKQFTSPVPPCSFEPLILGNDGNLYGTSQAGGATYQGTVFRMTAAGAIKIVYSFDYTHGAYLYSPVTQGNDNFLYGTTSGGGSTQGGVVFKLSTAGKISVLHAFDSLTEGSTPYDGLVAASDGNYYGATTEAPSYGSAPNGSLFKITSAGSYTSQYLFDFTHGATQFATSMQHTNGKIYGLTQAGGKNWTGVVYSLDNSLPPFVLLMTRWGSAGQTVQILGTGLTNTSSVKFGSGSATFNVVSDTYMTAVVPANGTTGFVTVTTPTDTLTSSRRFNVTPVVSGFSPGSGPVGAQVTITGSGFVGATQVTFGGVKATSFTVDPSGTSITATVPAGAKTGKVAVKTAGGSVSSKGTFTVT